MTCGTLVYFGVNTQTLSTQSESLQQYIGKGQELSKERNRYIHALVCPDLRNDTTWRRCRVPNRVVCETLPTFMIAPGPDFSAPYKVGFVIATCYLSTFAPVLRRDSF